jgi:N-acetylglucosamine transport system permease protein
MAAYVLARYPFRGNRSSTGPLSPGCTVPIYMGILPLYLLVNDFAEFLGLRDVIGATRAAA